MPLRCVLPTVTVFQTVRIERLFFQTVSVCLYWKTFQRPTRSRFLKLCEDTQLDPIEVVRVELVTSPLIPFISYKMVTITVLWFLKFKLSLKNAWLALNFDLHSSNPSSGHVLSWKPFIVHILDVNILSQFNYFLLGFHENHFFFKLMGFRG